MTMFSCVKITRWSLWSFTCFSLTFMQATHFRSCSRWSAGDVALVSQGHTVRNHRSAAEMNNDSVGVHVCLIEFVWFCLLILSPPALLSATSSFHLITLLSLQPSPLHSSLSRYTLQLSPLPALHFCFVSKDAVCVSSSLSLCGWCYITGLT